MFKTLMVIGTGSFIGGVSRFLLAKFIQLNSNSAFPYGTLVVNVLGCLVIGVLYGLFERGNLMDAQWRLFLTVGFCGGFTTFSTYIHENYSLFENQNFFYFGLYSVLSFVLGMAAVYLGHLIIKMI